MRKTLNLKEDKEGNFSSSHVQICELDHKEGCKAEHQIMLSNCGAGEDSRESSGQGDQTSQSYRKFTLNIHGKD